MALLFLCYFMSLQLPIVFRAQFISLNYTATNSKIIFFRSFINWYFFVFILLRILCWFRICHFSQVYFNMLGDIDSEGLAKIQIMPFFGSFGKSLFFHFPGLIPRTKNGVCREVRKPIKAKFIHFFQMMEKV